MRLAVWLVVGSVLGLVTLACAGPVVAPSPDKATVHVPVLSPTPVAFRPKLITATPAPPTVAVPTPTPIAVSPTPISLIVTPISPTAIARLDRSPTNLSDWGLGTDRSESETETETRHRGSAVHTYTGAYHFGRTDLVTHGDGASLEFLRSYNSADTRETSLGPGWMHSYDIRLRNPGDGTRNLYLVGPQGRTDLHTLRRDGTFAPRSDVDITLVRNRDGTHTATHGDGTTWSFNRAGNLTRVANPAGYQTRLLYDDEERITTITDPANRGSLKLDYDPQSGRLVSITDWLDPPHVVRYTYDELGRLNGVVDREEQTTRYTYHGDTIHLATIEDARGHVALTIDYDPAGQVVSQTDARGLRTGHSTTYTYDDRPDGSRVTTTFRPPSGFDPDWRTTFEHTYDREGELVRNVIQTASSDQPMVEEWVYNSRFRVRSHRRTGGEVPPVTVPAGALRPPPSPVPPVYEFGPIPMLEQELGEAIGAMADVTYDAFGRMTGFMSPNRLPGTAAADRTWRVEYDREDRVRFIEGSNSIPGGLPWIVEFRYDEVGNLIEVVEPDGTVTRYSYDERDSLVAVESDSGLEAHYRYDERNNLAREQVLLPGATKEQVADHAYDGLRRLRRTTHYPNWPDTNTATVTEYSYDADERRSSITFER